MPNVCGHLALVDSAWTSGAAGAGNGHKHRFTCTPLCREEIQISMENTNTTHNYRAHALGNGEKAQVHLNFTLSRICCFQQVWLKLYFNQTLQCAMRMQTSKTLKSLTQSKMVGKHSVIGWSDHFHFEGASSRDQTNKSKLLAVPKCQLWNVWEALLTIVDVLDRVPPLAKGRLKPRVKEKFCDDEWQNVWQAQTIHVKGSDNCVTKSVTAICAPVKVSGGKKFSAR